MAIKLALLAVAIALFGLLAQLTGRGESRVTAHSQAAGASDVAALVARIEALEAETDSLKRGLGAARMQPGVVPGRETTPQPDPRIAELMQRVEALERTDGSIVDELERVLRAGPDAGSRPRARDKSAEMEDAIASARAPLASEKDLLRALRTLRGERLADGTDARLQVLDEMLELARTSTDGEARADVWRQLSHVTDSRLRRPLLDALAFDEHAKAREEAAETLADFLPDPQVENALRSASESDPNSSVRRQARESLDGGR